jgi:hypothetical protein
MPLMNTMMNLSRYFIKNLFIIYIKYVGALVNPKDITVYSYRPYLVIKAVFSMSLSRSFS